MQYLYENLNSYDQDIIELLETVEGQLRESGYSERAVDCFIETADIHDFKSIIESSSLDEGVKGKFIKELGKKGLNFVRTQGKRLKDAAGKAAGKVKDVAKKNPKTTAVVGTTGVVGTALATSGDGDDKKETGDDKIKLKDPGVLHLKQLVKRLKHLKIQHLKRMFLMVQQELLLVLLIKQQVIYSTSIRKVVEVI